MNDTIDERCHLTKVVETIKILSKHNADDEYQNYIKAYRAQFGSCLNAPNYQDAINKREAYILRQVIKRYEAALVQPEKYGRD